MQNSPQETAIGLDVVVKSLYQSQGKIYPRSVKGVFSNWRWIMVWATQLFFYGVPWINWGNRQAMLFHLTEKKFYIFGLMFTPHDLIYLTFLLIISALALFLFTAVAGRLWCGYTCPQTVYTEMFLWIESKIEGDRASRIKLDQSKINQNKVLRKTVKHIIWIALALWTGFTFVGYFTPIRELAQSVLTFSTGPWETFWVFFYGFATYGNAGFMREQVCKYMCPYARFQSAMFDKDTLTVTYNDKRGEPRGARSKHDEVKASELGACVDCTMCVQVCPTGIDIRDGLQYECINCGLCVDICNTVMDKVGYARGLISYSTQNSLDNGWNQKQLIKRIIRPRILIYTTLLTLIIIGFCASLYMKSSFKVDVTRDRSVIARMTDDYQLENTYQLRIANVSEQTQELKITASASIPITMKLNSAESLESDVKHLVVIPPAKTVDLVMDIKTPDGISPVGAYPVKIEVTATQSQEKVIEKTNFIIPN